MFSLEHFYMYHIGYLRVYVGVYCDAHHHWRPGPPLLLSRFYGGQLRGGMNTFGFEMPRTMSLY